MELKARTALILALVAIANLCSCSSICLNPVCDNKLFMDVAYIKDIRMASCDMSHIQVEKLSSHMLSEKSTTEDLQEFFSLVVPMVSYKTPALQKTINTIQQRLGNAHPHFSEHFWALFSKDSVCDQRRTFENVAVQCGRKLCTYTMLSGLQKVAAQSEQLIRHEDLIKILESVPDSYTNNKILSAHPTDEIVGLFVPLIERLEHMTVSASISLLEHFIEFNKYL